MNGASLTLNDTVIDIENVTTQGEWNWELIGDDSANILKSGRGDDTLIGGAGDDTLDGGAGIDTVGFSGDQDSYVVKIGPAGVLVRDRRPDENGTDTLTNIEFLDFDTGNFASFNLDQFGGATSLNAADFNAFMGY